MIQRQERIDTRDLIRLGGLAMTMLGLSVSMGQRWGQRGYCRRYAAPSPSSPTASSGL